MTDAKHKAVADTAFTAPAVYVNNAFVMRVGGGNVRIAFMEMLPGEKQLPRGAFIMSIDDVAALHKFLGSMLETKPTIVKAPPGLDLSRIELPKALS